MAGRSYNSVSTADVCRARQMVKRGPAGMRACSLGLVGLGIRLGFVLGIGLVLGLAMVLGLAHFTFCHTSSPQKSCIPARPHFTHSRRATL